jgi:hypothetical protein
MATEEMKEDKIEAIPTKRLFIDILTRDISVRACILDLIDNSVDAYIRNELSVRREIRLNISKDEFEIFDNCGGIEYNFLKTTVFRFGADIIERDKPTLGIYGIGLKRAILKIGKTILMETDDGNKYCSIHLDVDEWSETEEWEIPFVYGDSRLSSYEKPYTKIVIKNLYESIKNKFDLDSFVNDIKDSIHITYTFFIENNIDFYVNDDVKIEQYPVKIRSVDKYAPTRLKDSFEGVNFEIICFIDPSEGRSARELGKRGWNVFCNNRLILAEDTTTTTGWSGSKEELPKYHPIYNDFRGIVFIQSEDPSKLPLNTSKTGLDIETSIYDYIRNKMIRTARPLIDFLSDKYNEDKTTLDEIDNKIQKKETKTGEEVKGKYLRLDEVAVGSVFKAPEKPKPKIRMSLIKYKKSEKLIKKVKKYLDVRTNEEVGEETFDYFVDLEGIEDE